MVGSARRSRWTVGLFCVAVAFSGAARADDARDVKIREELEMQTKVAFTLAPAEDCIAYLSDLHDIPIKLDTAALKMAGVNPQAPVTLELKNEPLEFVLWKILAPHKMSFMIQDHELLVTTVEKADKWQKEFSRRPR